MSNDACANISAWHWSCNLHGLVLPSQALALNTNHYMVFETLHIWFEIVLFVELFSSHCGINTEFILKVPEAHWRLHTSIDKCVFLIKMCAGHKTKCNCEKSGMLAWNTHFQVLGIKLVSKTFTCCSTWWHFQPPTCIKSKQNKTVPSKHCPDVESTWTNQQFWVPRKHTIALTSWTSKPIIRLPALDP